MLVFIDPHEFSFSAEVEYAYSAVAEDYSRLKATDFLAWPETSLYDFGWNVCVLFALCNPVLVNCNKCPSTYCTLQKIPGLVNAAFSLLKPGAVIKPHAGYTDSVLRFHLPIEVPPDCGLQVGEETRSWVEGRLLAFDDTTTHSAWNHSTSDRGVLLFDILRPGKELHVPDDAREALTSYMAGIT